jgi:two-component system KDP operon response regulator KdpE
MSGEKILIIDDDQTLLELLGGHLATAGYETAVASDGRAGVALCEEERPDLVILDVMMPDYDGWAACRELRERSTVPIIMLSAKGEEVDKLRGFRLGVDDYVTKPFSFAELTARARAVLGRTLRPAPAALLTSGDLIVDFDLCHVSLAGEPVELTPTEYRLLEALARNAHRTVPTEQLLSDVWGASYTGETDHVKHYIWSLRRKIEADPGDPVHIVTERSFGYRFE